jgi:hypothetical protein
MCVLFNVVCYLCWFSYCPFCCSISMFIKNYYYYVVLLLSPVTGLFSPALLLNQWRFPPFKLQVSDCNTFCIMCDVPSTVVFCSEFTACFPGMSSKFFSKAFVTLLLLLLYYFYLPFLSQFFRRLQHSKRRQPVRSVGHHIRIRS